jgi:hypothetical protein
VDASCALRRLTDKGFYRGQGATLYAVCEVLDRAALDISDVNPHVRSCLLRVAQAVGRDVHIDAGEDPSKELF